MEPQPGAFLGQLAIKMYVHDGGKGAILRFIKRGVAALTKLISHGCRV